MAFLAPWTHRFGGPLALAARSLGSQTRPLWHRPALGHGGRCFTAPAAAHAGASEQLTLAAARLSTVRCRELLAAVSVELVKTALVGSATASAEAAAADAAGQAAKGSGGGSGGESPEAVLDRLHASLQGMMQDAAHSIAPQHRDAWVAEAQWEVWHAAHASAQLLLLELHEQAARVGSAEGALQVARCLEHGLLVPQDGTAAFWRYKEAAEKGSAEGHLRCGIHFFEGSAPGGRDGATAFDHLSRALELADAALAAAQGADSSGGSEQGSVLPVLAPPSPEVAAEGDVPPLLTPGEVRYSALTWLGRCYLEGAGAERSVVQAADCFRRAGNAAELAELAELKRQFAEADVS